MDQKTFRSITPIFNFTLGAEFHHSGTFKDANFDVCLKKYDHGEKAYDELMRYADDAARKQLISIHMLNETMSTEYFLVIDVIHPSNDDLKISRKSDESERVRNAILDSLRLHSPNGLLYDYTYYFSHPSPYGGTAYVCPLVNQNELLHLGYGVSVLPESEFESCRSTFNILLNKEGNAINTFDKLLRLAIEYHKAVFNFQAIEHGFLILIVIFEVLFKKDESENRSQASVRISKLLSTVQKDQKKIHKEFSVNTNNFYGLRNSIAHGDPSLDKEMVKSKYMDLYRYLTKAIVKLIAISDGQIDHTKGCYDEISRIIDHYYNTLLLR